MSKNNHQQIDQEVKESVYCIYMLWFKFIHGLNITFLLLFGMVMYDNEFETMENKI